MHSIQLNKIKDELTKREPSLISNLYSLLVSSNYWDVREFRTGVITDTEYFEWNFNFLYLILCAEGVELE